VAARFVHISDCTDCVFFLHSLNRPVVMGNCKNIKLAPYNAPAYPGSDFAPCAAFGSRLG
jgi:hypothetical protein